MKTRTASGQFRPIIDWQSIYVRALERKVATIGRRVSLPSPATAVSPRALPRAAIPVGSEFFEDR